MGRLQPSGGKGEFGEHGDSDGLGTAVVDIVDGELCRLDLREHSEAVGVDRGLVDEEVLAAVVWGDKAKPFLRVEPLHRLMFLFAFAIVDLSH